MDEDITSIQLNPAVLKQQNERYYNALHRYMRDVLYDFFKKMYVRAMRDSRGRPELTTNILYIDRVNKVAIWPPQTIESITTKLEEYANTTFKFFKIRPILRKILSSKLCLKAATENMACSNRIQLNDMHLRELLFDMLKFSARDIANAPSLFISKRGREFVERERFFDFIFKRAIEKSLVDFVERYIYRIDEGTIENPLVPIPSQPEEEITIQTNNEETQEDEQPSFKTIFGDDDESKEANPFAENNNAGEEERERPDDEEKMFSEPPDNGQDPVLDPEKNPNLDIDEKDDKYWDKKRNKPRVYNPDDRLVDDEVRNPQKISFNEEVEIQPFRKEEVKPVLKPFKKPLVRRTYYDPKA